MSLDKVLCAVYYKYAKINEQDLWNDYKQYFHGSEKKITVIIPVIDHPHNDIENGQKEIHYHIDNIYLGERFHLGDDFEISNNDSRPIKDNYDFKFFLLKKNYPNADSSTSISLISKSKFKHKCIHKGKCPHRGMDLTNVKEIDGIITCPLHSLKFNAKTKKIIQ